MCDIMLDTGATRTLVRRDLVPAEKMVDGDVSICCAHGDTVVYPLAQVEIAVDGTCYSVEAAVSDKLPVSVLLGRDVPELVSLRDRRRTESPLSTDGAMAVLTRAQRKHLEKELTIAEEKDEASGAEPTPLEALDYQGQPDSEEKLPWEDFDPELFQGGRERVGFLGV